MWVFLIWTSWFLFEFSLVFPFYLGLKFFILFFSKEKKSDFFLTFVLLSFFTLNFLEINMFFKKLDRTNFCSNVRTDLYKKIELLGFYSLGMG